MTNMTAPLTLANGGPSRSMVHAVVEPAPLTLPPGRKLRLAGRGTTFIRELAGPAGAPVVMLLHGWGATADLNWHRSYDELARRYRVVALDHRGHGRGVRTNRRFTLEDCADDAVAVADALGIDQFIPVGYSMGGPIASLVWRRHRHRVGGLVLCATSRRFNDSPSRKALFAMLGATSTITSTQRLNSATRLVERLWARRLVRRGDDAWAIEQVLLHDWNTVLDAGRAIGRFDSTPWIGDVDVPAAVVATLDDDVVPTAHQLALAEAIGATSVHEVGGGHSACSGDSGFASALVEACRSVASSSSFVS